jgi:uncharacterized protein YutE (UPF0331/DUF86 family)
MSVMHDISTKLERLRKDCRQLETHRQLSLEEFSGNPAVQDDACYLLFTTLQGALDIGTGLLGVLGLPRPDDEAGVFTLLAEEEVLSQVCVSQLTAMQRLCNSLSQQYEEIDPQWVYQTLQVNLVGLNQFAQQVQAFLDQ